MKTMKVALLATAALAAVTVSARADETSALKAQLEALNARVAQLEAAPAAPIGYSMLTVSQGDALVIPGLESDDPSYSDKTTVIGVMPTADMPASTVVTWSGFVRAAITYVDSKGTKGTGGDDDFDIRSRGEIKVTGKTDTAVGEVGVLFKIRGDYDIVNSGNPKLVSPEYWGYWSMTPELTLGGGYTGTLANIGYGYDGACTCYYTDNADVAFNPGDDAQMRLSWVSGPISMGIAIEDGSASIGTDDSIGVAGEIKYSGDGLSGEISAGYWNKDDYNAVAGPATTSQVVANTALGGTTTVTVVVPGAAADADGRKWQVGAGLGFSLGDMANISLAAAAGEQWSGAKFEGVSALLSANLTDAVHAELGAGYKNYHSLGLVNYNDVTSALAGIYYDPVSQLTIGLEAEYINPKGGNNNVTSVDLVTVFRF